MNSSPLPVYPLRRLATDRRSEKPSPNFLPRWMRIFVEIGFVATFVVTLYGLRQATTAAEPLPPPSRLDFDLVCERYSQVPISATRSEVEALLGPPSDRYAWGSDIAEIEQQLDFAARDQPKVRVWDRWSDPKNEERWVAVLYAGYINPDHVYRKFKHGF